VHAVNESTEGRVRIVTELREHVGPRGGPRFAPAADGRRGRETLVAVAQRARRDYPLAALRPLADDFAGGALGLLFPHFATRARELEDDVYALERLLGSAIDAVEPTASQERREAVVEHLFARLPDVREALLEDARAIHDGDPAARSVDEVILAYPGFLAIANYRIAHELEGRVAVFPRLLTEVAHRLTGIDIHPGARIGGSFAIDHGTGIVIGETAVIGERVRLYQGVTLGAVHVSKSMERTKRHPTIGDEVTIYANATILGGETVIGQGSRIGGNVWLTRSVPPYSVVAPTSRVERRGGPDAPSDDLLEFNI